jgi:two-component system cell cycle sensor histidine kinase/response regulator CckA
VLGAVMVFRDVSEQRRLQRQIELADRLASVGTMAAGVANEVNEPLAAILSNLQYVAEQLGSHRSELHKLFSDEAYASLFKRLEEMQRAVSEAELGAHRVTKIVSELRTFARPPTNHERPVDLRRVLSWAGEVVAHEIRSRAALAMQIGTVPLVHADEARLGQVFINLLLNAAQAIAPGNVKDNEVRVVGRTAADGRAVIEVRDTGCGIPSELLGRIFDPFFTTKGVVSGTGLGLSICHGIVRSLGGQIHVESQVGKGSLFRVLLPPAPPEVGTGTSAANNGAAPVGDHGRILVIDDEPLVATAIRRALQSEHQVTCVKTVREAMAMVERGEAFDAILCDLLLPEVTGMDFYDDLLRTRPDVARRVVFMSGGAFTPKAVEFVASVSNRCLEKPFSAETLRGVVQQTISGGG